MPRVHAIRLHGHNVQPRSHDRRHVELRPASHLQRQRVQLGKSQPLRGGLPGQAVLDVREPCHAATLALIVKAQHGNVGAQSVGAGEEYVRG